MPKRFISNAVLLSLLTAASSEERLILTRFMNAGAVSPLSAVELQEAICRAGGHGVANWLRGQGTGYIDILDDVVQGLKISDMPGYLGNQSFKGQTLRNIDELHLIKSENRDLHSCLNAGLDYTQWAEGKVLLKLLEVTYERLSPEQRHIFDARVREVANRFGGTSTRELAGAAGLLAIGNLGGFATYTLMSTVLSGLSLGSLGFGAYTLASSALSVVLGPIGWIGLGVAGVYSFGKPSLSTMIPLVSNVAMIRQRLLNAGPQSRKITRK